MFVSNLSFFLSFAESSLKASFYRLTHELSQAGSALLSSFFSDDQEDKSPRSFAHVDAAVDFSWHRLSALVM